MRIPRPWQVLLQTVDEVGHLIVLGAEPRVVTIREDGIQEHQPLDKPAE